MGDNILRLCIPDEPASFRNYIDAKTWRGIVQNSHIARATAFATLAPGFSASYPVSCFVGLRVLHLHAGKANKRDTDNTAKPIMDALTGLAYKDDSQVKSLSYVSAPLLSKLGIKELDKHAQYFGAAVTNLMCNYPGGAKWQDVTLINLWDIGDEMDETDGDLFLHSTKSAARHVFG